MNVVLFGPPGAGKGTQAFLLKERYNLALISTGSILRDEVEKGTTLGIQIKETMDSGGFPSDDIILKIFTEKLEEIKNQGVILDGVPRTLNQAEKIDEIFQRLGIEINVVIQIAVDENELIKRLSVRKTCTNCGATYTDELPPQREGVCDKCGEKSISRRSDDEYEAVKTRFEVYNERTKPVIDYYLNTQRLSVVDGMKPVEGVYDQINTLLGKMQILTRKSECLYSAQDV